MAILSQEHMLPDEYDGHSPSSAPTLNDDVEKSGPNVAESAHPSRPPPPPSSAPRRYLRSLERTLVRYNIEARGLQRVAPSQRHDGSRFGVGQIALMWFSINLAAILVTLGMLGPAAYGLAFADASLLAVFGSLVGATPVAYLATFGPRAGHRTMVLTRYVTGWYPSKLIAVLALVIFMGYGLINAVIGGQILSAVSAPGNVVGDHRLSIVVGIVIVSLVTGGVALFGYGVFHLYERYAWVPQIVVLSILAGVAGPKFDLTTDPSTGESGSVVAGNRLSFFSLCLAAQITYAQAGADFFVYYPVETSRVKVFGATLLGLTTSSTFTLIMGVGLASGIANDTDWAAAYNLSQGALIVEAFRPLGGFGSFCSVVVCLSLVSNMVPPTYACGIDFQVLGRIWARVPRFIWTTVAILIPMVCAIAGRAHLAEIFTNFLALMGYWVSIWIAVLLEEHLLFRKYLGIGWDWEAWNDRNKLPHGIAALIAFLVGWAGAILCMAQVWYVGPLARLISEYGGDMGNYVGFSWAAIVYPPLRWFEWRKFGR